MTMDVKELRPGLWRWTAPHPEWKPEKDRPGGWGQMVGCLYHEPAAEPPGVTILIDPLAPPEGTTEAERFWSALDRDAGRRDGPVTVLLGNRFHERSARQVHDRYVGGPGAEVWAHAAAAPHVACPITRTFDQEVLLPRSVQGYPIEGLEDSEVAYWLPRHRALAVADALIGTAPGRVQVAPAPWASETPEGQARYRTRFRPSLRRLLDLPIEMLIVSHGEPVLERGREALEAALQAPAWGE